jgi:uncharacterized coiled-coil protein SlyX
MTEKEENAPDGAVCVDVDFNNIPYEDFYSLRATLNNHFASTATKQEKIEDLAIQQVNAGFSYTDINAVHKRSVTEKKKNDNHGKTKQESDTTYTREMGVDGMIHMLENKTTPSVTLEYVRQKHDKTVEWLAKTRGKRFYTQAEIVKIVEEQKRDLIAEYKNKGIYNKTLISNASTPYQQLNHLHHILTVNDRLDSLEERQMQQELLIAELSLRLTLTELNVELIDQQIGVSNSEKKRIAAEMSAEGIKQKDIADKLSVSTRTIIRWLKEGI